MAAKASFLSLPGELRNAIYEDVVADALSTIHIHHGKVVLPALAFTCRTTWKEMASTMRHSQRLATAEIHAEILNFDCHRFLDFLTRFDHEWRGRSTFRPVRLTLSFSAFTSRREKAAGVAEMMARIKRIWKLDAEPSTIDAAPVKLFDARSGALWALRLCWSDLEDLVPVSIGQNRFSLHWGYAFAHMDGANLILPGLDYVRDIGVFVEMLRMSQSGGSENGWELYCHVHNSCPHKAMEEATDSFDAADQQSIAPAWLVRSAETQLKLQSEVEMSLICHEHNAKEARRLKKVERRSLRSVEQNQVISSLVDSMSGLHLNR